MRMLKLSAVIAIALAVASPALADQPGKPAQPAPAAKAEAKAEKAGDKAKEGAEKAGDKAKDAGDKAKDAGDKAKDKAEGAKDEAKAEVKADKEATKKKAKDDRDALKGKVQKALKGKAMHPSLKEELKRRLARLERVEALAKDSKDDDAADRVKKLIAKENARHEKWMSNFDPEKGGGK